MTRERKPGASTQSGAYGAGYGATRTPGKRTEVEIARQRLAEYEAWKATPGEPVGPTQTLTPPPLRGRIPTYCAVLDVDTGALEDAILASPQWPAELLRNPGAEMWTKLRRAVSQGAISARASDGKIDVGFNYNRGAKRASGSLVIKCLIDHLAGPARPSAAAADSTSSRGGQSSREGGSAEDGYGSEAGAEIDLDIAKAGEARTTSHKDATESGDETSDEHGRSRSRDAQPMAWCHGRLRFEWAVNLSEIEDLDADRSGVMDMYRTQPEPTKPLAFSGEAFGLARFEFPLSECKIA